MYACCILTYICVALAAPPDVTKYQYDKTSGYYYDPTTGLYYEPNTQVSLDFGLIYTVMV